MTDHLTNDMPRRVQLRRSKGWKMPPNTVKVDRTTKWGNPFVHNLRRRLRTDESYGGNN